MKIEKLDNAAALDERLKSSMRRAIDNLEHCLPEGALGVVIGEMEAQPAAESEAGPLFEVQDRISYCCVGLRNTDLTVALGGEELETAAPLLRTELCDAIAAVLNGPRRDLGERIAAALRGEG